MALYQLIMDLMLVPCAVDMISRVVELIATAKLHVV